MAPLSRCAVPATTGHTVKFRTNRIAPLALATVLAFGAAACEGEDTVDNETDLCPAGAGFPIGAAWPGVRSTSSLLPTWVP